MRLSHGQLSLMRIGLGRELVAWVLETLDVEAPSDEEWSLDKEQPLLGNGLGFLPSLKVSLILTELPTTASIGPQKQLRHLSPQGLQIKLDCSGDQVDQLPAAWVRLY